MPDAATHPLPTAQVELLGRRKVTAFPRSAILSSAEAVAGRTCQGLVNAVEQEILGEHWVRQARCLTSVNEVDGMFMYLATKPETSLKRGRSKVPARRLRVQGSHRVREGRRPFEEPSCCPSAGDRWGRVDPRACGFPGQIEEQLLVHFEVQELQSLRKPVAALPQTCASSSSIAMIPRWRHPLKRGVAATSPGAHDTTRLSGVSPRLASGRFRG
ncbi:hypothetical protein [Arthrobacter sp. ISL-30]|uniref:hypothetical protein n=1 Tax=Arthrobacter sp. ISL-30 TaxID=2819109 RepID=UPI001BE8E6D3|nr:hypothetical protein [Arthrobacter sp. ISL-30]MBT2514569.1 hypothetical protein [Arthrobacter sp. ISL-30]